MLCRQWKTITFPPVEGREGGYLIAEPAGAEAAPQQGGVGGRGGRGGGRGEGGVPVRGQRGVVVGCGEDPDKQPDQAEEEGEHKVAASSAWTPPAMQ